MRTRLTALAAAAAVATTLGLAGCSTTDAASPAASTAVQGPGVAAPAPASPERVDAASFASVVDSPGVTIIDVRTPEEFNAGHIDGAVNYNVQGPDFGAQIATLDPAGTYAVYCQSGNRSQVAVAQLSDAGVNGIYELETGITGWANAGYPIVR